MVTSKLCSHLFLLTQIEKCAAMQEKKLADLVLWKPAFFGAKPEMIIKGGNIAWANMGDANASIPTPEPVIITDYYCIKMHHTYLVD